LILSFIRKSKTYAYAIQLARWFLPLRYVNSSFLKHCHFRGWFTISLFNEKIELFNFNTELETSLFWAASTNNVEGSLKCFIGIARIATHILDVGANTGIFAVAAASTNHRAKIYAIEPNYSNFIALKANVKKNGLPINCLNVAATSQNKLVTLWDFPSEISYSASLEKEFRSGQGATPNKVFGVKLDQILMDTDPNSLVLAKIDVESHEAEVVRGMSDFLENDYCQIIFVIEIIRESVANDLARLLPSNKFFYFHINEESRLLIQVKDLAVIGGGMNFLIVSHKSISKLIAPLQDVCITTKWLNTDAA
jgi:FkbM family methyltransferase